MGQWRRGGDKELDIKYQFQYNPPLIWDDGGEGWIARLTRLGIGAQNATITLNSPAASWLGMAAHRKKSQAGAGGVSAAVECELGWRRHTNHSD